MTATSWAARAACAGRLDLPWTHDTAQVSPWQAATMRAVCDRCPVVLDCLAAVDDLDVTGGWWAGRDRDPDTEPPAPPAWAATPRTRWVPVRATRRGRVLGEQLALHIA